MQQRWRSRQTQSLAGAAAEEVAEVAGTVAEAAAECIWEAEVAAECIWEAVEAAECVSAAVALVAEALGPAFAVTVASVLA